MNPKLKSKKPKQVYNPYESLIFQIESVKNRTRKALMNEYMIFLINLYGHLIQDGTKNIRDYKDLTMMDIRNEVIIRIKAMRGESNAKIRAHKEKEQKKQDELLRKLSRMN